MSFDVERVDRRDQGILHSLVLISCIDCMLVSFHHTDRQLQLCVEIYLTLIRRFLHVRHPALGFPV